MTKDLKAEIADVKREVDDLRIAEYYRTARERDLPENRTDIDIQDAIHAAMREPLKDMWNELDGMWTTLGATEKDVSALSLRVAGMEQVIINLLGQKVDWSKLSAAVL